MGQLILLALFALAFWAVKHMAGHLVGHVLVGWLRRWLRRKIPRKNASDEDMSR